MNTQSGRTRRAKQLKDATQFFYEHAGYSYGQDETPEQGRKRCALAMARAERKAYDSFYSWEWRDGDECIGCDCGSEDCACSAGKAHECYTCVLLDSDGKVLASLGSICQPDTHYRRVVEAELALEAIA